MIWKYVLDNPEQYANRKYALDNPGNTTAEFDGYLYRLADRVWHHALALTGKDYPSYDKY